MFVLVQFLVQYKESYHRTEIKNVYIYIILVHIENINIQCILYNLLVTQRHEIIM